MRQLFNPVTKSLWLTLHRHDYRRAILFRDRCLKNRFFSKWRTLIQNISVGLTYILDANHLNLHCRHLMLEQTNIRFDVTKS